MVTLAAVTFAALLGELHAAGMAVIDSAFIAAFRTLVRCSRDEPQAILRRPSLGGRGAAVQSRGVYVHVRQCGYTHTDSLILSPKFFLSNFLFSAPFLVLSGLQVVCRRWLPWFGLTPSRPCQAKT